MERMVLAAGVAAVLAWCSADSVRAAESKFPEFAKVTEGADVLDGVFKVYRNKETLLIELPGNAFGEDYLFALSLSRGIGQSFLLGGFTLNEFILNFRRVDDRVLLIQKNVRFRAAAGSPAERAVKNSYTDSVLAALPIATLSPRGGVLVDLSAICLSDFAALSQGVSGALGGGYFFDRNRSTYHEIKIFPQNLEVDVEAVYGSPRAGESDTVPDARSVQLGVHYSISKLVNTGYRPRLADKRVGYFVTAVKDYTKETDTTAFTRYVNRWHLEKADASADPSPPKKPIRFYLEETVPFRWRPYVKEGILAWNEGFKPLGFANAVEVMDLPDGADPEDTRYNTFR
ncbi:MAG: DUF5117 domain-containing protein, partial [Planctomycetia bacterium]